MDGYTTIESLGDGSYGTVIKATNNKTGEICAIKKFKNKYESWNECLELREVKSLRKLKHPNIIKLKEVTYYIRLNL